MSDTPVIAPITIPIKQIEVVPQTETPLAKPDGETSDSGVEEGVIPEMNMFKLGQYFEINSPSVTQYNQMETIYRYFEKLGVQDMNSLMGNILKLETVIGTAPFGVTRLGHIANYLRVLGQIGQLEELKLLMQK